MNEQDLAAVARKCGLADSYLDFRGEPREVSLRTRRAILEAMGLDLADEASVGAVLEAADERSSAARPAPERCYEPGYLAQGARPWGLCVQLYTLRSAGNWGDSHT